MVVYNDEVFKLLFPFVQEVRHLSLEIPRGLREVFF